MSDTTLESAGLSRRSLMKVGLIGGAFLATAGVTASLTGCRRRNRRAAWKRSANRPAVPRALLPVMLLGAVSAEQMPKAVEGAIQSLDHNLARLSPEMFKLTQQLFDVLALPLTRGPLTGIWGSWENASGDDVRAFLSRWENSFIGLLRMGHSSLMQLAMMAWYARPEAWAHCGYPGPPKIAGAAPPEQYEEPEAA